MKQIILFYFLLSLWLYALPQAIVEQIRRSGIPQKDVSIYIKEAGNGGQVIASLNADTTRLPASVIKVLTTYSAALKLGFDYRWPTKFYTTGTLRNGVLKGDLLIKGFGDPTLNDRDLKDIVASIKAHGIGEITGNIVIDRSYFNVGNQDSSGFDEYPYSPYNAMPDAMMFNERISTVCVVPKQNNAYKKNADAGYKLVNQLKPVNKPCSGKYSWPSVKIDKSGNMPVFWLKGEISKKCGQTNICQVFTKPYISFYSALKEKLKKEGIQVRGILRLRTIPRDAIELFTHYSKPLEEIISKTAKASNNLYARHFLLLLGAKTYGAPATLDKGRRAIREILNNNGALSAGPLYIENGCGLSRTAQLSAKILGDMLAHAHSRYGKRWMNTLSVAGVDGTIKRRFSNTIVKNRAWMKTGTVKRVKNISGYVQDKSGNIYTTVILVNTTQGTWKAAELQNNIIKWLAGQKR